MVAGDDYDDSNDDAHENDNDDDKNDDDHDHDIDNNENDGCDDDNDGNAFSSTDYNFWFITSIILVSVNTTSSTYGLTPPLLIGRGFVTLISGMCYESSWISKRMIWWWW